MLPGRHEGERGQALVEFALSVIVLFAVLFAIIDFGRALYTYDLVTSAARAGTRYASVRGNTCPNTYAGCPSTNASIQTYVSGISGFPTSDVQVLGAGGSPNTTVTVTVSVPFTYLFHTYFPNVTLSSTSQVIILQ
jgi:Flp pilus assembly protein TadG